MDWRMAKRFRNRLIAAVLLAVALGVSAWWVHAQTSTPEKGSKFSLARIRFAYSSSFSWQGRVGDSDGPPWSHDWPRAEENLMKIMKEVSRLDVNPEPHIITFENDECFRYPVAYLCEVGYIQLSDKEVRNMREYLLRGGFLIVDDFRGGDLDNFTSLLKQVFPGRSLEEVPRTDPIFTCFYDVSKMTLQAPYSQELKPQVLGMRDDSGRLMMVVEYNNDISEYWEWSADPFYNIDATNEAFKFGVNYIMYALSH